MLCNLVKTARQHCHLSEEERMQICFARRYIHFKCTLAVSYGGREGAGNGQRRSRIVKMNLVKVLDRIAMQT